MSKKRIRILAKKHLPVKFIGGKIFVERESLERLLADPNQKRLPLE